VSGLAIYGSPIELGAGHSVSVGGWAEVTAGKRVGRITAPLVVQLVQAHRGLPAGTTIAFAFGASPQVAKPRHKHHASGGSTKHAGSTKTGGSAQKTSGQGKSRHHKHPVAQPLTATPSLGYRSRHYVFPVDGGASYVDTYGAGRNDIYDGWHHGDDLFAPLGTPIVAVANGTLSLVGWNELGGWRLWLTDNKGNSFYYAHLAGYARWILKQHHVRAGQVIGFLGRTGDAFTTAPHLHFEIHPHLYVGLGYDGAVDPTRYLKLWKVEHVQARYVPQPARLKAPVGTPRQEAAVVWRQLLVARHLLHSTARAAGPVASPASPGGLLFPRPRSFLAPEISPLPLAHIRATAARVSGARDVPLLVGGPLGAVFLTSVAVGALTFRRRRRTEEAPPPAPEASS
jgi:murein DD-endopeptidase MepM/ murein hydrolase activator NlpD